MQSDRKEACTLSLERLPRHPFHGALKQMGGGLVVLLLAERAPSEGLRSTRAIENQPGHLLEKQTSKLGGTIVRWTRARMESSPPLRRKSLNAACFLESVETGPVAYRPVPFLGQVAACSCSVQNKRIGFASTNETK